MGKLLSPGVCVILYDENGNLIGSSCDSRIIQTPELEKQVSTIPTISTGGIAGRIIEDLDNNGTIDPTDVGIPNIPVTLTDSQGDTFVVYTGPEGNYSFLNVRLGQASVYVDPADLPFGATLTIGDNPSNVTVYNGTVVSPVNIGFYIPPPVGNVAGRIIDDLDANGVIDPTDGVFSSVEVVLVDIDGVTHNTTSDGQGNYIFNDIPVGNAQISVDETQAAFPPATFHTGTTPQSVNIIQNITTQPIDFLLHTPKGSVYGVVFDDLNDNGVRDAGEPGIPGKDITVTDQYSNSYFATTDANGEYTINDILAGPVSVTIDESTLPGDVVRTTPATLPINDTVVDLTQTTIADIGYHTILYGNVTFSIYNDQNGNGQRDAGEPPYVGVDVTLTDSDGIIHNATTDASGIAQFNNIVIGSATYVIDDSIFPSGYQVTEGTINGNVNVVSNTTTTVTVGIHEPTNQPFMVIINPSVSYGFG